MNSRSVYGVPEALALERNVQDAVDLAWEVADPDDDVIVVEEWVEGVPNVSSAEQVANWVVPIEFGSEAPPLANPSHRVDL